MTIVFGGDWGNQNTRPVLKYRAGAVTADVEQADVASCAVTNEGATANLRARSVLLYFAAATSTEAAGQVTPCSTGNAVWRPSVPVEVQAVHRFSLGLEEMATCDNFVLYGNAGTCVGGVLLKAGSTAPAAYTRTCMGAMTLTRLAAGTDLLVRRFSSTCSVQAASLFQLDYVSTG